ncbi:proline dehydrogenase [Xylographa opegraphella]|nr:proline dehydrogenase [Xylographa opegraphella]
MATSLWSTGALCHFQPVVYKATVAGQAQQCITQAPARRRLHQSNYQSATATTIPPSSRPAAPECKSKPPLSLFPLSTLLRSYCITSLSCSPILLSPSLSLLSTLVHSRSPLLNPDRNPLLRYALKKTFYAQFCAGENLAEVRKTMASLKDMGFEGVILGYAKEVVVVEGGESAENEEPDAGTVEAEVTAWRKGTLETVSLAQKGDYVALKFTGAGSRALHELTNCLPPGKVLKEAIIEICDFAKRRNVRILFDAEQTTVQAGIDMWTLAFQRKYNCEVPEQALVYGTYQAYLRSTPATLARHIAVAWDERFTLGVKLVRGAYLGSDPRHLFWSEKEDTDKAYNEIAESLIQRRFNNLLKPLQGKESREFPDVNLVLASHNLKSVKQAMSIRKEQLALDQKRIHMTYGQLMGMADHVSCELILARKLAHDLQQPPYEKRDTPMVHKYLVWGTVGECLKYLLRRAQENRDAVVRTEDARLELRKELVRRLMRN